MILPGARPSEAKPVEANPREAQSIPAQPANIGLEAPVGFVGNVLWNFVGIAVSLGAAFFLSPFVIRKLGDDNYGLWAVTTALVEYYWLLDFGVRSATVRFTAHYNAMGEMERLSQLVSTAIAYNLCLLPFLIGGTWYGRAHVAAWMHIHNPLFPPLLLVVAIAWALTSLFSMFTSCLEGLQRFDIINQSGLVCTCCRIIGIVLLLNAGYGVLAVAYMTVGAQVLLHVLNSLRLKRLLPAVHLRPRHAHFTVFKELLNYGRHSVLSSLSQRALSQSSPLIIAYFLPERFAGYYTNPRQLLDYTAEAVMRIGTVSNSRAAQLMAGGKLAELRRFSVSVNRLSLAMFLPLSIFLAVYGKEFLLLWIKKPEFVAHAAPVLLALLAGHTLGTAGQFSSTSILFGIARHQQFARSMAAEAVLVVAGVWFAVPRYGITGAAIWCTAMLILNRALVTPWLLTRELKSSFPAFLAGVNRPLLSVPPVMGALWLLRRVVPGTGWWQLAGAGAFTLLLYLPFAYLFLPAEDRDLIVARVRDAAERVGLAI